MPIIPTAGGPSVIKKVTSALPPVGNYSTQPGSGMNPAFLRSIGLGPVTGGHTGAATSGLGADTSQSLDPKLARLQAQNTNLGSLADSIGVNQGSKRPSMIHRIFDVLSRPEYAVADATLQGLKAGREGRGWGQILEKAGGGLVHGLAGTHKSVFENVAQYGQDVNYAQQQPGDRQTNIRNIKAGESGPIPVGAQIAALLPDIMLDPLNLVTGIGAAKGLTKAAKLASESENVSEATRAASKLAEIHKIALPGELEKLVAPASHIPSAPEKAATAARTTEILGKLEPIIRQQHIENATQEATAAGRVPQEIPSIRKVTTYIPPKAYMPVKTKAGTLGKVRGGVQKIDNPSDVLAQVSAKAHNARLAQEIMDKSSEAAKTAHSDMQNHVLEELARNTDPATIRRLGVKIAGHQVTLTPESVSRHLRSVNSVPHVASSLNAFKKAFVSTGRMSPELQALSGQTRGLQIMPHEVLMHELGQQFRGENKDHIGEALRAVVSGERGMNPILEQKVEARMHKVVDFLRLKQTKESGIGLKDYNEYLPKGMKLDTKNRPELETLIHSDHLPTARNAFIHSLAPALEKFKGHPIDYLHDIGNATIKAEANSAIRKQLTKFGVPVTGDVTKHLMETQGYKELRQTPGFVYHPAIHEDAKRMFDLLGSFSSTDDLTKGLGHLITLWKKLATVYNLPAYPLRNFVGNEYMAALAGGKTGVEGIKSSRIAAKAMMHRLDRNISGKIDPVKEVLRKQLRNEIPSHGPLFINKGLKDVQNGVVSSELFWAHYLKQGLESTFSATNYSRHPNLATGIRRKLHDINSKVIAGNRNVEDFSRLGVFAHHMRTGTGKVEDVAAHAGNMVRRSLFDYNDVTPFEKQKLLKLFPFYKWNRKAIPALFGALLDHPGKILNIQNMLRGGLQVAGGTHPNLNDPWGLDNSGHNIPSYILDRMSEPFGKPNPSGSQKYLDPTTPFNDVTRLLSDPSNIISQINPALRVPIEDTTRKQFFHNLPIKHPLQYSTIGQVNILRTILKATQNTGAPVGSTSGAGAGVSSGGASGSNPLSVLLSTLNPASAIGGVQNNTPKAQASALLGSNTNLHKKIKALLAQQSGG